MLVQVVVSQVPVADESEAVTVTAVQADPEGWSVGRAPLQVTVAAEGTLETVMVLLSTTVMVWVWVEPAPVQARRMTWMDPPGAEQVELVTVSTKLTVVEPPPPQDPPETVAIPVLAVEVSPPQGTVRSAGMVKVPVVPRMAKSTLPRAPTLCEEGELLQRLKLLAERV